MCGSVESGSLTSLEGLETSQHSYALGLPERQRRLLGPRLGLQERIVGVLDSGAIEGGPARARRMADCCRFAHIGVRPTGAPALWLGRCRDRMCQVCQRYRSLEVGRRIEGVVLGMSSPRMITLTMKGDDRPLRDRINALYDSFRRLRRSKAWRAYVLGGLAVLEVTRGAKGAHWHAHLHVLVDGSYFPHRELKEAWATASEGSCIVDIRPVFNRADAAKYIAKYASKSGRLEDWSSEALAEYVQAVHRRRMVCTFGRVYAPAIDGEHDSVNDATDTPLVSLASFARLLAAGLPEAWRVRELLIRQGGTVARILARDEREARWFESRELDEDERSAICAAWAVCLSYALLEREVRMASPGRAAHVQLRLWEQEGRRPVPDG